MNQKKKVAALVTEIRLWALVLGSALAQAALSHGADKEARDHPLPPGARIRLGSTHFRAACELYYADLTPDGRTIGYIWRNRLEFIDLRTGAVRSGPEFPVMPAGRLVFAPDGKRFATIDQNDVTIWEADTGRRIGAVQVTGVRRPQQWAPVAFSGDGKRLAVAWGRRESALVYAVWDVDRSRLVTEMEAPVADRSFVALSPDGKRLATWGYREAGKSKAETNPADDTYRTITVRDADTGNPIHRLVMPEPFGSRRVCFSPDGKTLAVIGRTIELWDTAQWRLRSRAPGRTGWWPHGHAVAFSPDSKRLAILHADGTVELRDSTNGDRTALVKGHGPGRTLRFLDNDRVVVLGGGEYVFRAWEVPAGRLLTPAPGHLDKVGQVAFTPDGKQLLSVSEDGVLIRWDVATGEPVPGGGLTPPDYARWVGSDEELLEYISPDGARAVFAKPYSGAVRVFDLRTRKEIFAGARKFDMTWTSNVTCSPRGTRILLNPGSRYGYPTDARPNTVWDLASGRKLFDFPQQDLNRTFFSPDDRLLIVVGGRYNPDLKQEGVAGQVWDAVTGKQVATFEADGMCGKFTAGIAPDRRTLVVSSLGRQVIILDLPAARRRQEAAPAKQYPQSPVLFSPDGRLFAFGQGMDGPGEGFVQVWETASGSIRHTLDGHRKETPTIAFSPDGKLLASGSKDATVILWDLEAAVIAPELQTAKPDVLWERLGQRDAAEAHPAMRVLIARPADAVAVIGKNLEPASSLAGPAEMKRLIARLDAEDFTDREAATKALTELGAHAEELLKETLSGNPPPEVQRRLQTILAAIRLGPSRELVRSARAVEVLERIGNAEALRVLLRLASGRPGHAQTEDAKSAVSRLIPQ